MSGFVIHLMRHGPPLRTGLLLGHCDEPARAPQAPALIARAAQLKVGAIMTSDLRRAADTAQALAPVMDLPVGSDRRWRELDFGAWDGKASVDLPADDMARFWNDPDTYPAPGGERWTTLLRRVRDALDDLAGPTLVITHAGAMRAAVAVLTGLDHRGVWALDLPYGALLSLRVWPGPERTGQIVGLDAGAQR
jgi:alpha-ribazole phosphatase